MCCSSDLNLCANCKAEPLSETECLSKGEVHPVRDTQRRPRPHTLPLDGRVGDVPILAALTNQGTDIVTATAGHFNWCLADFQQSS